jgi:hypothetical protein
MEWLEQNIDAYRIVSEILGELRLAVRQRLEQIRFTAKNGTKRVCPRLFSNASLRPKRGKSPSTGTRASTSRSWITRFSPT